MYQIVVGIVLILVVILILNIGNKAGLNFSLIINRISNHWKESFIRLPEMREEKSPAFQILSNFLFVLTSIFFIVLALTGFLPILIFGGHLSGILLIIHVTTAPLFVLSFMLTLVFKAQRKQFTQDDFKYLNDKWILKNATNISEQFNQKLCFWLFAVFSLPAILSMVLSMYPLFGTGWQVAMLNLHQFSVLVLLIVSMFYLKSKYLSAAA